MNSERGWRGGERQLLLLMAGQKAAGLTPWLLARREAACVPRARALGVDIIFSDGWGELDPRAWHQVFSQARAEGFSLFHAHTAHAHTFALGLGLFFGVPTIVHRRVDFPLAKSPFSRVKYGHKSVYYIAISQAIRQVLLAGGVAGERIRVVPSAVPEPSLSTEAEQAPLRQSLGLNTGGPVLGVIGALVGHKGHRVLVDALPELVRVLPGLRLLIVGDGPLRSGLERQVARLGLKQHVLFLGFRPDVHAIQQLLSVQVVPSLQEGLNTAMLDALHLQIPVVASACGGIPEVLTGVGTLVPPGESGALSRALLEVLTQPKAAGRLAALGKARVVADHSVPTMVDRVAAVYDWVLGRSEAPF